MLGHRELTVEDYLAILRRRIWLIVSCAIVLLVVALVVCSIIPPKFESQTLILIEQPKVPEDYVKPVVTQDLGQRLASMREQIRSRSRLEPIINRFNLHPEKDLTMDDRVALTQKDIDIKAIPSGQSSSMPGFFITFKAKDAHLAQQVCSEISSQFVTGTQNAREETAKGTTDFLKQQLSDSKKSLDAQDARLASFQQKYFGRLPDQEQSNSNTLQALTTQLDAVNQSLSRQQQNITFLQAMISQQSHDLQNAEPAAAAAVVDERRTQLRNLILQRQALTAQYTSDYPDVVDINRKISDLQAQIAASAPESATASAPVARPDTPQLQQLKAQYRAAQQAMDDSRKEQQRITQQVRNYEARIESSPQVEAEYKQITRDHETALEFYNSLLKKLNDSSMATALEQRQQGEQFRVMDAPNLPDSPVFPNRLVFAAGGFIGGIMIGLLLTVLFEYRDTTLRTEQDIWAFTKLSTLAVISHIDGLPQDEPTASRWNLFAKLRKPTESPLG